ncbi:MAG: diguanylate cyclase, partial [Sphaerochaetaceae bacterium]|nr:diguanylate cyclase [Sphaerochaetaceae bacterium]
MSDLTRAVPIAQDLWWVGTEEIPYNLQCNSYLMINGDTGIIFEPGSAFSAGTVIEKVSSLIPIQNIEAIVCSHQDPDLCMGIGEFEKAGFRGVVCCHERTAMIMKYYGFSSPFYLVNQHEYVYTMNSGLSFTFLFTPYLHFPGSIMVYLKEQKTLMSGDVFGSVGVDWTLYAGSNYLDGMVAFHEVYMPSHRILSDAMRTVGRYDITMICPQHGSIISDSVERYIEILRELPCGLFLEVKKEKVGAKGDVINAVNKVLTRLITIHGIQDVKSLFRGSGITIDAKKQRIRTNTFPEKTLWQTFFSLIEEKRGATYLSPLAPFTERVSSEHGLPLPPAFSSLLASSELEIIRGREALEEAQKKLHALEESLYLDPITGLYNQDFYEAYLKREVSEIRDGNDTLIVLLLGIDNLDRINLDFGSAEGDRTMRTLGELISSVPMKKPQVCRLAGGIFALVCHSLNKVEAIELADVLRASIAQDERFIVPITVSMGLYHSGELPAGDQYDIDDLVSIINQSALFRL